MEKWVEECLVYGIDGKIDIVKRILNNHSTGKLYKYRPLNDFSLENLETETFYMSKISDLNDPFEFYPSLNYEEQFLKTISDPHLRKQTFEKTGLNITDEDIRKIKSSKDWYETFEKICKEKGFISSKSKEQYYEEFISGWFNDINEARKHLRIISFSAKNNSPIMWSHYSDCHKGICIEYDTKEIILKNPLLPVTYSNMLYKMPDFEDVDAKTQDLAIFKSFLIKAKNWDYEDEWRIVIPIHDKNRHNEILFYQAPKPTAIYLGHRFSENTNFKRKQLENYVNKYKTPVFSMRMDHDEYKMIPIEVNL